ncbi:MAG: TetR/AcrR family transcriptional regulator [Bacteroidetes bacterium]|nr:MAG: TetR/AcrR family transcriptional regulator [Bacteroidota bacterium]
MNIRNRITEGAADLFRTYGIKSVTMDSLANHLGISKRTIYENFKDKDELLIGVLNLMTEKQKELLKRVLNDSENAIVAIFKLLEINMNHFQEMCPTFIADMKRFQHDVLAKKSDSFDMPDYRSHIQLINKGIEEKLFKKEINADLVNRCLYFLVRSIMDEDLYPFEQFTRREVLRNTFISYLRGISTNEGVNLVNKLEAKF